MSRHSLQPLPGRGMIYEVAIGWDRPLGTFFVIIFGTPDDDDSAFDRDELTPLLWEGTAPGALSTPDAAIALASSYAVIPDGLAAQLAADREADRSTANGPAQSAALAKLWPKPKGRP
jgi:hypothetical protein